MSFLLANASDASSSVTYRVQILSHWLLFQKSASKMVVKISTGKDFRRCVFTLHPSDEPQFLFQSWVSLSISVLPKGAVPPIDEPRFNQNAEKNGSNDKAVRF